MAAKLHRNGAPVEFCGYKDHMESPWSLRRPQRYVLTVIIVVAMLALAGTAISLIVGGSGGIVPVLMLTMAPILAIYYVWYFNFSELAREH